jgi:hypothetical protein
MKNLLHFYIISKHSNWEPEAVAFSVYTDLQMDASHAEIRDEILSVINYEKIEGVDKIINGVQLIEVENNDKTPKLVYAELGSRSIAEINFKLIGHLPIEGERTWRKKPIGN